MRTLTMERVSGIKSGYWSPAKKEDLVQKLGRIEHRGGPLIRQACGKCPVPDKHRENTCPGCPLTALTQMIEGEDPAGIGREEALP